MNQKNSWQGQGVLFIGAQACGKSSFYKQFFSDSHIRLNLDMLKTRNREKILLEACIYAKQNFVIDNTNPSVLDRKRYITPASRASFEIVGYYFSSCIEDALARNRGRKNAVPDRAILSTFRKLELPSYIEGFHKLYYVKIAEGIFQVEEWRNEI